MNDAMYMGFESYLNNEMPADEKIQFEEKLLNDADFLQQFELYKQTTQFLEMKFSSETAAFKQNLKAISSGHFSGKEEKEVKVISFKPFYYAVAASVAVVFGLLFFNQDNPQYNDYNQHETAAFTQRGDVDTNVKMAQDYFNAHDYQKAVKAFENIHLLKDEWQFYYAIALIETNSYKKGDSIMHYFKNGTSIYKDKATWYLALSCLKQDRLEECRILLQQIPQDAEDYEKAQELLDDLD